MSMGHAEHDRGCVKSIHTHRRAAGAATSQEHQNRDVLLTNFTARAELPAVLVRIWPMLTCFGVAKLFQCV